MHFETREDAQEFASVSQDCSAWTSVGLQGQSNCDQDLVGKVDVPRLCFGGKLFYGRWSESETTWLHASISRASKGDENSVIVSHARKLITFRRVAFKQGDTVSTPSGVGTVKSIRASHCDVEVDIKQQNGEIILSFFEPQLINLLVLNGKN